ncbi:MAG: phosphate/phosphite/phosphonate ABC transporter substrate-binding protein, partial [Pseudomonadales bacterium]|nr:phosphate/phosphite/phosphonate ABC transporter substrate-binding protein [Pseudomonadales bacterium]
MPDTLVIGKISHNPKKHYRYLKPMSDYVAGKMSDLGIKRSKVRLAKSRKQLISWLRQGKVDWVTETSFAASIFVHEANAEPILLKHKKGDSRYRSLIFTRKDSGINSLQDLKEKIIAFEDEASTSAFYAPATLLIDDGLKLFQLDSVRESPPNGKVGFVFAGEEITIATWVEKGLADAGTVNNQDWA